SFVMLKGLSAGGGGPSPRIMPISGGTKAATSCGVGIWPTATATATPSASTATPNKTPAPTRALRSIASPLPGRALLEGEVALDLQEELPWRRHVAAQLEAGP